MSGSVRRKCTCISEYQDRLYGKGIRIKNICGKAKEKCRCTVCNREDYK